MPNYQKMYHLLFHKITNIIEELQEVQQQAEELYLSHQEPIIKVIEFSKKDSQDEKI